MSVNEQTVIKAIRNGNIKEFELLFRSLYAPLCGYALKILKDADNAEEIVQEVFYVLWKNRDELIITTSVKSYLYRAVQNRCIHLLNHKQVERKYTEYLSMQEMTSPNPEQAMQSGELYEIYNNTLKKLPELCRQIFEMNRQQGLKYKEIARELSISVKTVEAHMGKALKAFRQSFTEYQIPM